MTETERPVVTAADDRRIRVARWVPSTEAKASVVVQLLHGLGEHLGRYQRFATACCDRGFAVIGHDHRGHGPGCDPQDLGHFADRNGWDKVVNDAIAVQRCARKTWPDIPIVLLGHSMGSFIAQSVAAREPDAIKALILSASTFSPRMQVLSGRLLARLIISRSGGRGKSPLLNRLGFGSFNQRFAPARTDFDWLSRDAAEVDQYIADPYCGMPLSNRLWYDLLGGLLEVTSFRTLRRIPTALPILITGGENDPVGGRRGQGMLASAYRSTGHLDVTLKLYPDGRHEMLNEMNRDEFTRDLLHWIERKRES
jgi:alpha-beta hydrolase superfamily lysophospholipase